MKTTELAKALCKLEGKKKQVNIAQMNEIVKALGKIFAGLSNEELLTLVAELVKRGKK